MLFYPKLPKIIGSDSLEVRIRSIHGVEGSASACHVFGHTHFSWDAVLDGIRYIHHPVAFHTVDLLGNVLLLGEQREMSACRKIKKKHEGYVNRKCK
jgi:hypothetical protein